MSIITHNPEFSDVLNDRYVTGTLSVNNTQVEAKVNASRLAGRELVCIQNTTAKTVYYGPSGVTATTGMPLYKDQFVSLPLGEYLGLYLICSNGETTTVIVQEIA